jgi:DnaJ-class molecular chaperone
MLVLRCVKLLIVLATVVLFGVITVASAANDDGTTSTEDRNLYDVLEVAMKALPRDIKKAYRALALKLHPDKFPQDSPDLDQIKDKFIEIQKAYDVLGDEERRKQYDLSLDGIDYDILENKPVDRYHGVKKFSTFAKGKRFSMSFTASFEPEKIDDLRLTFEVPLGESITGTKIQKTYYRRVLCDACDGKGAASKHCKRCKLCGGTGVSNHLMAVGKKQEYTQMTNCICAACHGTGCIAKEKCKKCKGSGFSMEEKKFNLILKPGFANGAKTRLKGESSIQLLNP